MVDGLFLLPCSEMPDFPKPQLTKFQQAVFIAFGATLAAGGAASLFAGSIFFHASQDNLGWIFAPFAVILGALTILLALKVGKQT